MRQAGYWPSVWPVECGGNQRAKVVPTAGLNVQPTDHLVATTRRTGRWPVMFVQRDEGELYLHGTTSGDEPEVSGWVERVDPLTLEPTERSGNLTAGGHEWCGSIAVHRNGDLYTVNGSCLHRLAPDCSIVAEATLPVDHAHNGLLVLSDGSILTKDIRVGDVPSTLTVCDPDLAVRHSLALPEASMGRLAAVAAGDGDDIYVVGSTRLLRYRWDGRALAHDPSWQPTYRRAGQGGLGWDATVVDGRVWLMDNGNIPAIERRFATVPPTRSTPGQTQPDRAEWADPVRALGFSIADPGDVIALLPTEAPGGWIIAPPLIHDGVAVAWDTANTGIAGFELVDDRRGEMLWFQPFRPSMQPIVYADTHELVINDFRVLSDNRTSDDLVVVDLRTGQMKARVGTGATRMNAMFLCPGWDRDVYYCTFDTVARVRVESL